MRFAPTEDVQILYVCARPFGCLRLLSRTANVFAALDHLLQHNNVVATGDDKRHHPRLTKRVKLRYRSGPEDKWRSAFSQDVSTYGIYIHSTTVPTTSGIEIEVIDEDETIALMGVVVRGKKVPPRLRRMIKSGFAVNLLDVPDDWHRYCLDLEEKARERGQRFLVATTEVSC